MEDQNLTLPATAPAVETPIVDAPETAIDGPDGPKPKRKPLEEVYDYLLSKKVAVPENYADFEAWISDDARLKKLHDRMVKDKNVDVSTDYETFKADLYPDAPDAAEKKKALQAGTIGSSTSLADSSSASKNGAFQELTPEGEPLSRPAETGVDAGAALPFNIPKLPEQRLRIIQEEEKTLPSVKDGFKRVPLPDDLVSENVPGMYKARNSQTGQRYIDQPLNTKAEGEQEDQPLGVAALRTFTNGLVEGAKGLSTGMGAADRLIRGSKMGQAIDRFGEKVTGGVLNGDPNRGMPFDELSTTIGKAQQPIAEVYQEHNFLQKPSLKNLVLGTADLGAVAAATLPAAIFPESGVARLSAGAMGLLFDGQIIQGAHERAVQAGMDPTQAAAFTLIDSALELGTFRLGGKALTGVADKVLPKLTRDAVKSEIMKETYRRLALRSDESLSRDAIAATIREATAAVTPRIAKIAQEAAKNSVLFGAAQAKQVLTEAAAKSMTGARFEDFSWANLGKRAGEGAGSGFGIGLLTGAAGSIRRPGTAPAFESDATDAARAKRLYPGIVRFGDAEGGAGRVTGVTPDHQTITYSTKDSDSKTVTGTIHADHVFPSPGDTPIDETKPRVQVVDATGRVLAPSVEVVHHIDNGSGSSFYVVRLPGGKLRNVPAKQVQRIGGPATEGTTGTEAQLAATAPQAGDAQVTGIATPAAPAEVLPTEVATDGVVRGVPVVENGDNTILADYNPDGTPVRLYQSDGTELDLSKSLTEPESRDRITQAFDDHMAPPGEGSTAPALTPEEVATNESTTAAPAGDPLVKRPVFTNAGGAQVFADYDPAGKPVRVYTDDKDYDLDAALGNATIHDKVVEGGRTAVVDAEKLAAAPAPEPAALPTPAVKPAPKPEPAPAPVAAKPTAPAPAKPAATKRADLEAQIAAAEADAKPAPAARRSALEEKIAAAEATASTPQPIAAIPEPDAQPAATAQGKYVNQRNSLPTDTPEVETARTELRALHNDMMNLAADAERGRANSKSGRKRGQALRDIEDAVHAAEEKVVSLLAGESSSKRDTQPDDMRAPRISETGPTVTPPPAASVAPETPTKEISSPAVTGLNEFEQRRADGSYAIDGNTYVRQAPLDETKGEVAYGKTTRVEFATGRDVPVRYAVVDAETMQPSHTGGTLNRNNFFSEDAQPKDRTKGSSAAAIQRIANNPDIEKVSASPSPFDGAPIINGRGEVIQGNGRGEGLRQHYSQGGTSYRAELDATAQSVGIDPATYSGMQRPVLVRVADVNDPTAIELGNYKFEDKESGGVRRLDPRHAAGRLSPDQRERLAGILVPLTEKGETETLKSAIRRQQRALKQFFADTGAANETQLETMFSDKGAVTPAGIEDVEALVQHLLLSDVPYLPQQFEGIRDAARNGIRKALASIVGLGDDVTLLPQIRTAIGAARDYEKAGGKGKVPFATWAAQGDLMNPAPSQTLSPLELRLTELLATRLETEIASYFNRYANAVRAESNPLFGDRAALTRPDAVSAIFDINQFTPNAQPDQPAAPAQRTPGPASIPADGPRSAPAGSPARLLDNAVTGRDENRPGPQPSGAVGRNAGGPDAGPGQPRIDVGRVERAKSSVAAAKTDLEKAKDEQRAAKKQHLTNGAKSVKNQVFEAMLDVKDKQSALDAAKQELDAAKTGSPVAVAEVDADGVRTEQTLTTTQSQKAGYIDSARTAAGNGVVTVYNAQEQGIDTPDKYAIVCEEHGNMVTATSLKGSTASMKDPASFCEECRAELPAGPAASAAPAAAPATKPVVKVYYNGKVVEMDPTMSLADQFKFGAMRIADNLETGGHTERTGFVLKPNGEVLEVSRATKTAKVLSGDAATTAKAKFAGPAAAPAQASQPAPASVIPPVRPPLITATPHLLPTVPERVPAGRYKLIDEEQRLAVNLALDRFQTPNVGFLLADGTGVGKTMQIIALASEVAKKGPVLVITANQGIIDNNFAGDTKKMGVPPLASQGITMGTYTDLSSGKFDGKKYALVIYDEAHNLKNSDSGKATKARNVDATNAAYVTATPMDTPGGAVYFAAAVTNRPPAEIWDRLGLEYTETKNDITGDVLVEVKLKEGTSPSQIVGNIAKLRDELYQDGAMIRREYPFFGEISSSEIPLTDLQATEQAAINDYWDDQVDENPRNRMNLRGQQSGDASRWNEANKAKYVAKRIAEELAAGRKVVVVAEGVNDSAIKGLEGEVKKGFLNTLAAELNKLGIPFAKVYGAGNKGAQVQEFQNGTVDVLLGTGKSAGTGYDMDDSAGDKPRTLIMVTPPYGGDTFQQILGRVSRRNTKSPAKVEIVYTKADVDARRKEIIDGKLRVLKAIQDGTIEDEVDTASYDRAADAQKKAVGNPTVGVEKLNDRMFLVMGEGTKVLKEDLKRMGARWYKDKTSGKMGWMFPNYRQPDVEQYLRDQNALPPEGLGLGEAPTYTELEKIQQKRQTIVDTIKGGGIIPENGIVYSSIIPIPPHLIPLYIDYLKTWIDEGVLRASDLVQRIRAGMPASVDKYDDDTLLALAQKALDEHAAENAPPAADTGGGGAATPPPATPPASPGSSKGGRAGGGRYKRRTVETIKENPSISSKLKAALDADEDIRTYLRRSNALNVEEAQAVIDLIGEDAAYDFAMEQGTDLHKGTYQMLRQELVRRLDAKGAAADAAGDDATAKQYMRRSMAMFERLAKKATEYGQANAALVELLRATPDRAIYEVRKNIAEQVQRAMRGSGPAIENGVKAAKQVQQDAIDETLAAVGDQIELSVKPRATAAPRGATPPPEVNPTVGVPEGWGKTNKLFTMDWVQKQLAKLKNMSFSAPIPPQYIILGLYHIEAGAREFTKFSRIMVSQLGQAVKPRLLEIYQRTRDAYVQQMGGTLADYQLEDDATIIAKQAEDLAARFAGRVVSAVRDPAATNYDPEAMMLSTLMSKVRESIPDATSLVDGQPLKPTKNPPVPMRERIAEAVRNADTHADLWAAAKDEVMLNIETMDVSNEVKERLHDRLENFYQEVIGQPYSDRQVQQAVSAELANMGPDGKRARIESIIRKGLTEVKYVRDELVQRLVTDAGLTPEQADQLAKSVESEFMRRVEAKRDELKKGILNPIKRLVVRGNRTFADKLLNLIKLGAFDDADVAEQYAEHLKLPVLTAANIAELRRLAELTELAPEGFKKERAMTDLLAYQMQIKGVRIGEVLQAMWYSNVLSSYLTQSFNVATNVAKMTTEVLEATLHGMILAPKRPDLWLSPARGLLRGMGPAWTESLNILKTGYEPNRDLGKYEAPNILEIIDFAKVNKMLGPLNVLKYVTRMMKAGDVFFSGSLAEMRSEELAILEAIKEGKDEPTAEIRVQVDEKLFHTSAKIADAKTQAEDEGDTPGTVEYNRRVYEIMQQQRDVKLREEAREYGLRMTFNAEMEGSLGAVISGFTAGIDKVNIAGFRPLRLVFPFTKVPTNIINEMMNYTPLGFTRAARGGIGIGGDVMGRFHREYTPHERQRSAIKAALGTATFVALYALTHSGDDKKKPVMEVTGGGSGNVERDRELREGGWQPYSIRVGDNIWIPYASLPNGLILAAIGHINDQEKYGKDDIDGQKLAAITLFKTLQFAEETSPLRGPADFLGALNSRNPDVIGTYLTRLAGGSARGMVPMSGLTTQAFKDAAEALQIPKKDVNTIWGNFVQDMAFARRGQKDAINALGEPVQYDTDRYVSTPHKRPNAESAKVWDFMLANDLYFSKPSQNTVKVMDQKKEVLRPLTEDEYYRFIVVRGKFIKEQVLDQMADLLEMEPEERQKQINTICSTGSRVGEAQIQEDSE